MAVLYHNIEGYPVRGHSHSGGQDWKCPKKYFWKRLKGWQSKEERSALQFGNCVEAAIQYHHTNFEPESGVDEFTRLWWKFKDDTSITYTEKSGDYDDHMRMGKELLALYEASLADIPLSNAEFQVKYRVDLFSEGPYKGLQYTGKVDMICTTDNNHPLLPKLEGEGLRKFIVDIKTSSNPYYSDPRLSALDDQLRDYAWMVGVPTVAFLVLIKNPSKISTGDWVTILKGDKAGKKYQVLALVEDNVIVLPKGLYDEFREREKSIKGKGATERKEVLLTEYFYKGINLPKKEVTKQSIQFLPAIVSEQDQIEARREATHEAMEISSYGSEGYYPKRPGVRFPNNVCTYCDCLGLCLGDEKMVQEKLVQITTEF